jgi:hypothetical protein
MVTSKTNEQALEALIEKALVGSANDECKQIFINEQLTDKVKTI